MTSVVKESLSESSHASSSHASNLFSLEQSPSLSLTFMTLTLWKIISQLFCRCLLALLLLPALLVCERVESCLKLWVRRHTLRFPGSHFDSNTPDCMVGEIYWAILCLSFLAHRMKDHCFYFLEPLWKHCSSCILRSWMICECMTLGLQSLGMTGRYKEYQYTSFLAPDCGSLRYGLYSKALLWA